METQRVMTEQDKLTLAAENYLKLEEKYKLAINCLNEIYNDLHTQMGTNARIWECLNTIEENENVAQIKECTSCDERFSAWTSYDTECASCEAAQLDEEE